MKANADALATYVSVLQDPGDGTLWLHVQMPTGALTRGPYRDLEEAQAAALALERVARRRWAQEGRGPGDIGGRIGGPAPQGLTRGHPGKKSP